MKHMRLVVMMVMAMALTACNGRHETLTSAGYGDAMLSGEVFVTGATPEGVEVSVGGTGMTTTLRADGLFAFAGVPENADLHFRRASDGIEASLTVDANAGPLLIEVSGTSARKTSRRRSAGRGSGEAFQFEGLIRSAAADSIVVFTSKGDEVTIGLTPETVIRKGNRTLTVADLVVDARVHVKARKTGEAYSAIEVKLQEGSGDDNGGDDTPPVLVREYEGTVRSAAADSLVVFTSKREEVTFALTATTEIRKGNTPVLPADILPGTRVHVKATENADGTKTAVRVTVQNTNIEVELEGTVTSNDGSTLIVTNADGATTVQTTSSTQIRRSGRKINLSDVTVGSTVEVEGRRLNATTVEAKKITLED